MHDLMWRIVVHRYQPVHQGHPAGPEGSQLFRIPGISSKFSLSVNFLILYWFYSYICMNECSMYHFVYWTCGMMCRMVRQDPMDCIRDLLTSVWVRNSTSTSAVIHTLIDSSYHLNKVHKLNNYLIRALTMCRSVAALRPTHLKNFISVINLCFSRHYSATNICTVSNYTPKN